MAADYINFRPFVGKHYFDNGFRGKRILVLGESHYCLEDLASGGKCFPLCRIENMTDACFSKTEKVLNEYINDYDGYKPYQTFLCFERAVVGKALSQKEREDFWQGVIFYNYIQFSQPGPRCPLQTSYWKGSEKAFRQVLETYLPDYIIAWGNRLYNGLPDWGGEHSLLTADGNTTDVWTYTINGKNIPMIKVHHPSAPTGKNWEYWHKFYRVFLNY